MPTQSITIDRYTYRLAPRGRAGDVMIQLYDERSNLVCTIVGVPDDRPLPDAEEKGKRQVLYYRRSVIPDLIDMLRNEGPVYLIWDDDVEPSLSTAFEPVGEAEQTQKKRRQGT